MNEKSSKNTLMTIMMSSLVLLTGLFAVLFWRDMKALNQAYADMNKIEFISSSTQRLINLATSNQMDSRVMFVIGQSTDSSLKPNQSESLSVLSDVKIVLVANQVILSWEQIEEILEEEDPNFTNLALARDSHFKSMNDLSNAINDYANELNTKIAQYQAVVLTCLFAIGMLMFNNMLRTHTELKLSKALAATAQIDTATGLYNRSRCQELFKNNNSMANKKQPAILVLDLNDLKKTNDSLGHRVGDELIQSFANVLKNASVVHVVSPFIGRYGGDEFIVYYEDVSGEEELKIFLKELAFCTDKFNSEESRFQISYAVGYSYISSEMSERLTTRQLFDKADEAMYENKIAGKRARNPNYDEESSKREVR